MQIEDNPEDREFFRESLSQFDDYRYEFAEGVTGKDAPELCRDFRPDCVILDYHLPQRNGLDVLKLLQDSAGEPMYAVVMLTGRGSERLAVESLRLGAQDYLVKDGMTAEGLHRAVHNARERFLLRRELSAKKADLEEAFERLRVIQGLTAEFSAGAHLVEVAETLVNLGRRLAKADTAIVLRRGEDSSINVLASHGYTGSDISRWQPDLPTGRLPVADSLLTGQEHYFESYTAMTAEFPTVDEVGPLRGLASFASIPIKQRGRIVAAVGLGFRYENVFTASRKAFFHTLLRLCGDALERAALYDEEIKRKEEMGRAVLMREEFLSIASHELKTPITALKLQLQLARRGLNPATGTQPDATRAASHYDAALKQVARLSNFVNDLLDVSQIRAGKLTLELAPVPLDELIYEVSETFRPQLEKGGAALRTEYRGSTLVHGDAFRIEQVLNNLFTNAIKYAPGAPITIETTEGEKTIELCFRDEGPGIPPDRLPYIFERFERASSDHRVSGLGLGLYILRQVIVAQGGSVRAESPAGQGTTFFIRLPKAGSVAVSAP